MSEVIETFIRSNPGLSEAEAFDGFLKQDRIRAWVGTDPTRRERLSKEFSKVWGEMANAAPPPPSFAQTTARAGPAMAQAQTMHPAPAPPKEFPAVPPPMSVAVRREPRRVAGAGTRKLDLLCPECGRIDVWNDEGVITCRACWSTYGDMLALIPVQPVGAFEYVFGDGTAAWLTAGGMVVLLATIYLVVKFAG